MIDTFKYYLASFFFPEHTNLIRWNYFFFLSHSLLFGIWRAEGSTVYEVTDMYNPSPSLPPEPVPLFAWISSDEVQQCQQAML